MNEDVDRAIVVLRGALEPIDIGAFTFEQYLEQLSIPLRISELVSDGARAAFASRLVIGYKLYGGEDGKGSLTEFCDAVVFGLKNMGLESVPSAETLRVWYYVAAKDSTKEIQLREGFGMASACYVSNDPEGKRGEALCAAAKQVASETNMGAVTAARQLKVAYAGHGEQEYAEGLPKICYIPGTWMADVLNKGTGEVVKKEIESWSLYAVWRDGSQDFLGITLNPQFATGRERIAAQHIQAQLHLRKLEA